MTVARAMLVTVAMIVAVEEAVFVTAAVTVAEVATVAAAAEICTKYRCVHGGSTCNMKAMVSIFRRHMHEMSGADSDRVSDSSSVDGGGSG